MANNIYIINQGFSTDILALKNEPVNSGSIQAKELFYDSATTFGNATILFEDDALTTVFDGDNLFYPENNLRQSFKIDSNGVVSDIYANIVPTITLAQNTVLVEATINPVFTDTYGATYTDDVWGTNPIVAGQAANGTQNPATNVDVSDVNMNVPGTYQVVYSINDGYHEETLSMQVEVQDTTAPNITVNGDLTVNLLVGETYTDDGITVSDIVSDAADITTTVNPATINTSVPGTYVITYTATDEANPPNTATNIEKTVVVSAATYSVVLNPSSDVDEGSSFTATFSATTASTGPFSYDITGVDSNDINVPLNDTFSLDSNGEYVLVIAVTADSSILEGDETLVISFLDDGTSEASASITINDTSALSAPSASNNQTVAVPYETLTSFSYDVTGAVTYQVTIDTAPIYGTITTVQSASGLDATYTPNAGVFNQSDVVTYTVTANGQTDTGQITFNISAIPNVPPVITNGASFATGTCNQLNSYSFDVIATDPDNQANSSSPSTLTYSADTSTTANGGIITITGNSYTYTPDSTYSGSDTFTVVVSDGQDTAQQVVSILVLELAYVEIYGTAFDGSTSTVCELEREFTYYMSSLVVSTIDDIAQGQTVYTDIDLTTPVTTNTSVPLISVEINENDAPKILGISPAGIINSVVPCSAPLVATSTDLIYGSGDTQYCNNLTENITVYYIWNGTGQDINLDENGNGLTIPDPNNGLPANATIEQLTTLASIDPTFKIFSSQAALNDYAAGLNDELIGLIPAGIYANTIESTYAKTGATNNWQYNIENQSYLFACPIPVVYITRKVSGVTLVSANGSASEWEYCTGTKTPVDVWYRASEDEVNIPGGGIQPAWNLEQIAQNGRAIYTTEAGATYEDISLLFESNTIGNETSYLVWENDGDGSNYRWYGFNPNSGSYMLAENTLATYGQCEFDDTTIITDSEFLIPANPRNLLDKNTYYAFLACEPLLDDTDWYWPVYVIDGLHEDSEDSTSHIKDFIESTSGLPNWCFSSPAINCLQYKHKIVAENSTDAVNKLKSNANLPYDTSGKYRLVEIDSRELGLTSESVIKIYDSSTQSGSTLQTKCELCANDFSDSDNEGISTYQFPILLDFMSTNNGPNFDIETNYNLDNVSKPLLRTNPKLSTNIKLVVNSRDILYLESIDADRTLSDVKYKKFPVSADGEYSYDVSKFFKNNPTTNEVIFATKRKNSDTAVLDSYNKQIEEDYHYGTTYNYSKLHSESLRMFAPIWLDENLPKKFVIFRTSDPNGSVKFKDSGDDKIAMINEIVKNSQIVKTFDLSENSNIGKYLRTHVQQEKFPKSPLTFSFEKEEQSFFNGIDLKKGGFTSKGEFLYRDFILKDKTLIESNDLITDGFKRNNIACANLINLEFLFEDDSASDYSINRYFGLYVDDIDSGSGEIAKIDRNIITFQNLNSYIDVNNDSSAIPPNKLLLSTPTLGYINVADSYYKISNKGYYDNTNKEVLISTDKDDIADKIGIRSVNKTVDILNNENAGYDFIKLEIIESPETNDSFAIVDSREEAYSFLFIKRTAGEEITINMIDGTKEYSMSFNVGATWELTKNALNEAFYAIDENGEPISGIEPDYISNFLILDIEDDREIFYLTEKKANLGELDMRLTGALSNIIRIDKIQSNVQLPNNTFRATYDLEAGKIEGKEFSNQGTLSQIAAAIANVVNNYRENKFSAWSVGSSVYIKNDIPGYRLLQQSFLIKRSNVSNFIYTENVDIDGEKLTLRKRESWTESDNLVILDSWKAHYLSGGNSAEKSVFVSNETVSQINIGDYIETGYRNTYNQVIDIVEDIETPSSEYSKIILKDKNTISNGDATVFNEQSVNIGLFSSYDIYDMDFDFYDTSNSELKELNLETRERMLYEPYENAINSIDPITGQATTELDASTIVNDDFGLEPINYFTNLSPVLKEESSEEESPTRITSEYDRLQENYTKEYAINSRIVPNINKWVLKDSITVREKPYFLNANEAFGVTNFSPDLQVEERSRDNMTHEWFYMDKMPKYIKYNELNDTFSYINFIEGFELTPELFKSTNFNYFDRFMISDGFEKTLNTEDFKELDPNIGIDDLARLKGEINTFFKTELKKKYSLINDGSEISFANTIFKGINVEFRKRKSLENTLDFVKDTEFNGYKFSILLKHDTDVQQNSIEYEIIQNKKYEFVLIYINLNISDFWIDDNFNRKMLYEIKHKLVYDSDKSDYVYANTSFGGSFNFNSADWSNTNGPYVINGIQHSNGSLPNYETQIAVNEEGLYGDILIDLNPLDPSSTKYKMSIVEIDSETQIQVANKPVNVDDPTDVLDVEYLPNSIQLTATYEYVNGGTNMHQVLLEKLSIGNFTEILNTDNEEIKYITVEEDGQILENQFVLRFFDGKEFAKKATLTVEEDDDKPKSFKLSKGNIGFNLFESKEAAYYPFLIRHSGKYTVNLKPVITFTDTYTHFKSNRLHTTIDNRELNLEEFLYKHSLVDVEELNLAKFYYRKYNRCGTSFNLNFIQDNKQHDANWGIIKNHFYHKVNELNPLGVTKLSVSTEKLPLYPLIGEIAIDKKNVNVFRSSWDSNYFIRSLKGGSFERLPGTIDTSEERSYMASTIMKPKDGYTLLSYSTYRVKTQQHMDEILKNDNNKTETVIYENEKSIIIDFYVTDVLKRVISEDGVLSSISKYVTPSNSAGDKTTIEDDALLYVKNNLLKQYIIDSIFVYSKKKKGEQSNLISVDSVDELSIGGYSNDNNFRYKQHKQKPMNFRLIYSKRRGYSYDIKTMLKIKS